MAWTEEEVERRNRELGILPCGHPPAPFDGRCGIPWCSSAERKQSPAYTNTGGWTPEGKAEQERRKRAANKYGVAPKEERTVGLLTFASKAEAHAYQTLLALSIGGSVQKIELQPAFKFPMGFEYRADFRVTYTDGTVEVIDVKGMETPVFKLKAKCMAHFYPEVKLSLWKRGSKS